MQKAEEIVSIFVQMFNNEYGTKCKNLMDVKEYLVKNESIVNGNEFFIKEDKAENIINIFLDAVNEWQSKTRVRTRKNQIIEYCGKLVSEYLSINFKQANLV